MYSRISIITPSFNQAAYLEETIESVLGQGYPNLEYIVIDGGSTDGSVEIIRRYERHLAYWISEPDRGQTHAINKGMARATGDILAYINSDDYYLPGTFGAVAECFANDPSIDLLHGRCRIVDQQGRTVGSRLASIDRFEEIIDLWRVWWNERNFVQPEVFWSRRIADQIGTFREDLYYVMDYEYWARILRAEGKVAQIDREMSAFRLHGQQKSGHAAAAAAELLQVVEPWLWERKGRLSLSHRLRMQGDWLMDSVFRPHADASAVQGDGRWRRHFGLALLTMRYPALLCSNTFRNRVTAVSWLRSDSA